MREPARWRRGQVGWVVDDLLAAHLPPESEDEEEDEEKEDEEEEEEVLDDAAERGEPVLLWSAPETAEAGASGAD